jgi:predicted xylose isomerase-like sugar epimerase
LPKKATKLHPLSEEEKASNRRLSQLRVKVEHAIGRLKHFKILSERFRHPLDSYDDIFAVIAGLVNFMRIERLGLAIPGW